MHRLLAFVLLAAQASAAGAQHRIEVDAGRPGHRISPLIYGLNFATPETLLDLNSPLNRSGGNSASMYNWRQNARNSGRDWYFQSLPANQGTFDQLGSGFVALTKRGRAQPMLMVPMLGWVAKLGPQGQRLAAFSVSKYGPQQASDREWMPDAGNGIDLKGRSITGNDPHDAARPSDAADQREWIRQLVREWGTADRGGVAYYLMDNEPSLWHQTHRHVRPVGAHASEIAAKVIETSAIVKSIDPSAKIVAPEEWGWTGYFFSGFDQQHARVHGWARTPDRIRETGGMDYIPWLLKRWKAAGRPVDVVSVHFYPQGGEYEGGSEDRARELLRNRSTRVLWDPSYRDTSWINERVALIPRLRQWVDQHYWPGTPIALTEYNWGAEGTMNGATAQADLLGIFGREGLHLATRWPAPAAGTPVYKAMKLYRDYDGRGSGFGDVSVPVRAPAPDSVSAFGAIRGSDGALTLVLINKEPNSMEPVSVLLAGFPQKGQIEIIRLEGGKLSSLERREYSAGRLDEKLPAQSVTMFILRRSAN